MESPAFNEASLEPITAVPIKIKSKPISREQIKAEAPPSLQPIFSDLWHRIDIIDTTIRYYEAEHKSRPQPPQDLISRLTPEEVESCKASAAQLNQRRYLLLRHQLVALRTDQYTIRDAYKQPLAPLTVERQIIEPQEVDFEVGIEVLPLGIINPESELSTVLWRPLVATRPPLRTDLERPLSDLLWAKKKWRPSSTQRWFDFRDREHLHQLVVMEGELADQPADAHVHRLLATWHYYLDNTPLTPVERTIVDLKAQHKTLQEIADALKSQYNVVRRPCYISGYYHQTILEKVARTARLHELTVENLFFDENFRACKTCGQIKLIDSAYWARKAKSPDGYSSRCKECDHRLYQERKQCVIKI